MCRGLLSSTEARCWRSRSRSCSSRYRACSGWRGTTASDQCAISSRVAEQLLECHLKRDLSAFRVPGESLGLELRKRELRSPDLNPSRIGVDDPVERYLLVLVEPSLGEPV